MAQPTEMADATTTAARAQRITAGAWWALGALFGLRLGVSVGDLGNTTVTLAALALPVSAWLAWRTGPRLLAPLLLYGLLPQMHWNIQGWYLGWAAPPVAMLLLGAAAGAACALRQGDAAWRPLWRSWGPAALCAVFALALMAQLEWPRISVRSAQAGASLDLAGAGLGLIALCAWQGRALGPAGTPAWQRWAMPALLWLWLWARVQWMTDEGMAISWGWASHWSVALALLGAGVLFGPPGRAWWGLALVGAALIEVLRINAGLAPFHAAWADAAVDAQRWRDVRFWALPASALGLAAWSVSACIERGRQAPLARVVVPAVLAVVLVLAFEPMVELSHLFSSTDPRAWVAGAATLALVWRLGPWALLAAPLALAGLNMLGLVASPDMRLQPAMALHAGGVAALAAAHGFVGWLLHRYAGQDTRATRPMHTPAPVEPWVDLGDLASFVHRLDVSMTLRSFGVLLVLIGVVWTLVQTGLATVVGQVLLAAWEGDRSWELAAAALVFGGLAMLLALLPLLFLVTDAWQRRDGLRPLAALSGTVCAAIGQWICGLLCSALLLLWAMAREEGSFEGMWEEAPMGSDVGPAVGAAIGLLVLVATVWRSAALRVDLLLPIPRAWLFGDLGAGGFWRRLASLLGLPASMWRASALSEAAFWSLLLARPLVYLGVGLLWGAWWWAGIALVLLGHASFLLGKRLAAQRIWRVDADGPQAPVLFLRSFEDDQFDFRLPGRNLLRQWLALWSFRRNLDETLVDEAAARGPVVALGRPGEREAPFGAERHYASHDDWQALILRTARRARAIVIAAGSTPGVLWEYEMLKREGLLQRTLLVFQPGRAEANRAALQAFPLTEMQRAGLEGAGDPADWVALLLHGERPLLLRSRRRQSAAYLLALRLVLRQGKEVDLRQAAALAPEPGRVALG